MGSKYFTGSQVLAEHDGNNSQVEYNTQAGGVGGIGGLLGVSSSVPNTYSQPQLPHYDAQGNVIGLSVGWVGSVHSYDAYGNTSYLNPNSYASASKWGYSTKEEVTPGLLNYGARLYKPEIGRWLSRDPAGEAFGANLYQFNYNNPVNFVDPDGQNPLLITGGIGLVGGGAFGAISAWRNGGDIWQGARRGAIVGGLAGLTGGVVGGALATSAIGTALGSVGSGALTGAVSSGAGDLAGQWVENVYETRCGYDWGEVGLAAGFGGVTGGFAGRWATTGTTTISRWGSTGYNPGSWVMPGRATLWNYVRSFKWQPGFGNTFAPFKAGQEFKNIPKTALKWPQGFFHRDGWWKGLFGQRIYRP